MELSKQQLEHEIKFKNDDLKAFHEALRLMRERVYVSEITPTQLMPLHEWAGARGIIDLLEVITHNMERVFEELQDAMKSNELVRRPFLHVVPMQAPVDDPPEPPKKGA